MAKLTKKQEVFCQEFLVDLNATQAAIRAGYSKKTARQVASENLSKLYIQEKIQMLMDKRAKRTELTADRVLAEIMKLAFSNISDYVKFDDGYVTIKKKSDEFTREELACISEVSKIITHKKYGEKNVVVKFKLYDKKGALELLGKHLKLFGQDTPPSQPIDINVNINNSEKETED